MSRLIVHEWISRTGGSEKVLDAMVEAFPDAQVWCLWNDVPDSRYPGMCVRESWLAHTPLRHTKAAALPLMPLTWRMRRDASVDWVLASSHLFAHHIALGRDNPDVRKFAYVYTPARYIWNPELDARGAGWLPRLVSPGLRRLDRRRAQESYRVAAISAYVRDRVRDAWDRDADIIYPPVAVNELQIVGAWRDRLSAVDHRRLDGLPNRFLLGASRFIPYKRLDLVIAAGEATDTPVVLAGSGPELGRLCALAERATVPVRIVDHPSDELLYALYEAAEVFVFLAVEDFGIMPVEAMALGTPVVARATGGASETVLNGVTGAHVGDLRDARSLSSAVEAAMAVDPDDCRARAREFGAGRFSAALTDWARASSE